MSQCETCRHEIRPTPYVRSCRFGDEVWQRANPPLSWDPEIENRCATCLYYAPKEATNDNAIS